MSNIAVPCRIKVKSLVSSRYPNHARPLSWEQRVEGVDVVSIDAGGQLKLFSDGSQSPPQPGWELILTEQVAQGAYRWTLYGLGHQSPEHVQ
ncbi:MAG: hypothetical protein K1X79_12410 [Oligoflexia bacterium]|nr:hypothetical protein [Oligoflexia bacterium]